jgi:asparagine synthase (glutamine-hydrolysing)
MCGINGIVSKSSNNNIMAHLQSMNNQIIHRGPNDTGVFVNSTNTIALGMQRLSIIDLNGGKQPMQSTDGNITIVFNGEIYNFLELRKKLISEGVKDFKTDSDTEIILRGYEKFGIDFIEQLNGMFAIAIYDERNNKLFLIRDRVGEKPLYYWMVDGQFVFCSELKSLLEYFRLSNLRKPIISNTGLNLFFSLTFIPAPHTIYEEVYKLQPGHILIMDLVEFSVEQIKYWNVQLFDKKDLNLDYSLAQKQLQNLLYDAVEKRMISDVPYGAFLSGGVDSSIITAIMADINNGERIKTFSIVSDNKYFDESARSSAVAKYCNTEHYPIKLDLKDIENDLNRVILSYDEPFADSSALPTYFVSKITKNYVTVALTGDGGDEVFGGYNRYLMSHYSAQYKKVIPNILHNNVIKPLINVFNDKSDKRGKLFKLKKFILSLDNSQYNELTNIMKLGFLDDERIELLNEAVLSNLGSSFFNEKFKGLENTTVLQKVRMLDKDICLEGDMLVKVDRASMLNSLECRPPLLDHRLIEFSFTLPDNFLISGNKTKRILKESFEHLLPANLFKLPKSGFGIPIGDWLRGSLKHELLSYIDRQFIEEQGLFNYSYINTLCKNHLSGISDNTFRVWTYFCFQKWFVNIHKQ